MFGDHRPGQRRSEKILVFVLGARTQSREDVVAQKFLAQVFYDDLCRAGFMGLLHNGVNVFALAHVGNHCDYVTVIVFLQPWNDDGGVEPSRICQYYFFTHDAPHKNLLVIVTIDPSTARRLAALRSGFRQESPAHPLPTQHANIARAEDPGCGNAHASLRLNSFTHDCSLWARCACRCPAVKVKLPSECACGSLPGQTRWTAANRSRPPLPLRRDAPAGSA